MANVFLSHNALNEEVTIHTLQIDGFEQQEEKYRQNISNRLKLLYPETSTDREITRDQEVSVTQEIGTLAANHIAAKVEFFETETNIPIALLKQYAEFSCANDVVLSFRDPGAKAKIRMDEGASGKGFTEKAKSSKWGEALAGYIPVDQSFSKAGDSGQSDRFNKIVEDRFKACQSDIDLLNKTLQQLNDGTITAIPREVQEILDHTPVAATLLQDKNGKQIFGMIGNNGQALRTDQSRTPRFAYEIGGKFFDETTEAEIYLQAGQRFKPIEVLSYITAIEQDKNGKYILKTQKITGDHDQLAIGTKGAREAKVLDSSIAKHKGYTDGYGLATTAFLAEETKSTGAVRHGQDAGGGGAKDSLSLDDLRNISAASNQSYSNSAEFLNNTVVQEMLMQKLSGNPHPEDFAVGNYTFIYPEKTISIAHNEQEIIAKFNAAEAMGYNMDINPRYGWQRNEQGKLEIDPNKISAQEEIKANTVNLELIERSVINGDTHNPRIFADQDAKNIYEMHSLRSLIKLQLPSSEKKAAIKAVDKQLLLAEAQYFKDYNLYSPSIKAIVNPGLREVFKNKVFEAAKNLIISPRIHDALHLTKYVIELSDKPLHHSKDLVSATKDVIKELHHFEAEHHPVLPDHKVAMHKKQEEKGETI